MADEVYDGAIGIDLGTFILRRSHSRRGGTAGLVAAALVLRVFPGAEGIKG